MARVVLFNPLLMKPGRARLGRGQYSDLWAKCTNTDSAVRCSWSNIERFKMKPELYYVKENREHKTCLIRCWNFCLVFPVSALKRISPLSTSLCQCHQRVRESENAIFGSSRGQITSFQLKLWSEVITHLAKLGDCDLLLSVRVEEGEGLPEAVDVLGGDLPVEAPHGGGQPGLLLDAGPGLGAHPAKDRHSALFRSL